MYNLNNINKYILNNINKLDNQTFKNSLLKLELLNN